MSERGDDRPLGGEHLTVHADPLKGLRASLLVEAEGVEIEPLPGRHSRNTKPAIGEAGRGGAEPAVAIEDQEHAPLSLAAGALRHCGSCMIS